jgi:dUTP pyrophosphatase
MPSPITVKVKRLAHGEGLPLPQRMTEHSAGFDISAAVETNMELKPGDIQLVPCGFAMAIPQGYEAQIRPRSGLAAKHGITMINTPGTIDSDYRGEIRVPLINLGKNNFTIERGMRIAQMLICPVPQVALEEVEDLDSTSRGHGGFGHTGTK